MPTIHRAPNAQELEKLISIYLKAETDPNPSNTQADQLKDMMGCLKSMAYYEGVEYIPNESGTARLVKCPLVDDWIQDIDCMENQEIKEAAIPVRFKQKTDWKKICQVCPFRNY